MTAGEVTTAGLAEFAQAHALRFAERGSLPATGGVLSRDSLVVHATAEGKLHEGTEGTIALLSYTYRSNDTTHTRRLTAALIPVPESIAFAPYLADANVRLHGFGIGAETNTVEVAGGSRVYAEAGIDKAWLHELFSPALGDWLARSPEGFGWELADGLLVATLDEHRTGEADLDRLCEDAVHLADAIREESLEEVDSGAAERTAAKRKRDPQQELITMLAPHVPITEPPANVTSALGAARDLVVRNPSTYLIGLFMALVWTIGINVIGAGIFGLLLNLSNPLIAVLIFELIVVAITAFLSVRSEINGRSKKLAAEVFWREYARGRALEPIDARTFAATHAKAGLRSAPDRVLVGNISGVDGALALKGEGLKRGDWIGIVAGPAGPVASANLELSAPGPSAAALDTYAERLAAELSARR